MLSRVAERLYWMGRYLERAENLARLLNVYSTLLLDLPRGAKIGWHTLLEITACEEAFSEHHQVRDERAIIRFLLSDTRNPVSIVSALDMVRENARTTREIIPAEAWERINNLYLYAREHASQGVARGPRHELLQQLISYCQQLTGLLEGAMSHNSGHNFISVARNLERADMTTRIVHAGSVNLLPDTLDADGDSERVQEAWDNVIWMSVLRSLSAYQMYRQHVLDRVNGEDVVTFLLQDTQFPRTVVHCLARLELLLKALPKNEESLRQVGIAQRLVKEAIVPDLMGNGLSDFIDRVQVALGEIDAEVSEAWFLSHAEVESD